MSYYVDEHEFYYPSNDHVRLMDAKTEPKELDSPFGEVSAGYIRLQAVLMPMRVNNSTKIELKLQRLRKGILTIWPSKRWCKAEFTMYSDTRPLNEFAGRTDMYCMPVRSHEGRKGRRNGRALVLEQDRDNIYKRVGFLYFSDVPEWDSIDYREVCII